jgi:hypothetical protein
MDQHVPGRVWVVHAKLHMSQSEALEADGLSA